MLTFLSPTAISRLTFTPKPQTNIYTLTYIHHHTSLLFTLGFIYPRILRVAYAADITTFPLLFSSLYLLFSPVYQSFVIIYLFTSRIVLPIF